MHAKLIFPPLFPYAGVSKESKSLKIGCQHLTLLTPLKNPTFSVELKKTRRWVLFGTGTFFVQDFVAPSTEPGLFGSTIMILKHSEMSVLPLKSVGNFAIDTKGRSVKSIQLCKKRNYLIRD